MAGNANSGRYPAGTTLLGRPRMKSPDGQSFRVSRRLNGAILEQAERAFQNGDKIPNSYLEHIRWNIERVEGKPTVKLDAQVAATVQHDPSLVLAAMRELEAKQAEWLLLPDITAPNERDVAEYTIHDPDIKPGDVGRVPGILEVGRVGPDPLRNVSTSSENFSQNQGQDGSGI